MGNDPRANETYYFAGDQMYEYGNPVTNSGGTPYVKKYAHIMNSQVGNGSGNNLILIRLSEIYLMYSEIMALNGNTTEALKYLNRVRQRAGLESLTATGSDLLKAIKDEKFKELCCEGVYWFDLIRWDEANDVLSSRGFVREKNEVFPIPQRVLDNNGGIVQNPEY